MKHIIAGTAGHIDHGKTSLVRALTGIDTDRLEEEKRRGISIDLGFAHMQLAGDIRIAFVDVPGHERFIKNMLAGVGGIDLVLFVVAADESIKPQTREHFEICRLLRIPRGVIALTKADLVDPELLDLVRLEVEEFVTGSFLQGAPVIAVSATTGAGISELKDTLASAAKDVTVRDDTQFARLPLDRAFLIKGFGTVVTGTLTSGRIHPEDELELHPSGKRVRVRGVQVHGETAKFARAGQRTAVNLTGADLDDLGRGMVLSAPGVFQPTTEVDCSFELLAGAHPLRHLSPVHFHTGTSETEAELRLFDSNVLKPGTASRVRFRLKDPVLMLPGDRFIVRMFSPVVTIGGGVALDVHPPPKIKRADSAKRLASLEQGSPADRLVQFISEAPFGLGMPQLVSRTGMTPAALEKLIPLDRIVIVREPEIWLLSKAWIDQTLARWRESLKQFHRANPLLPGIPKQEMRSRELPTAPPFLFDALLTMEKLIATSGESVRLAAHKLALKQEESEAIAKIEAAFESAGLTVPSVSEVLASSGVEPARARSLLQILLRDKKLVRISEDLVFHPTAISKLRELISSRKGTQFAVPEFKDWTGISRKYAIPLLEFLDRERVTRREGDKRIVL